MCGVTCGMVCLHAVADRRGRGLRCAGGQVPWWLAIVGVSLSLRPVTTLPLSIIQVRAD